jgi:hypothetical protein
MRARRRALTGVERLDEMLEWGDLGNQIRYEMIRQRNPDAAEPELIALWTEETYRHSLAPAFLAKALAAIRARGAAGPATPSAS